MDILRGQRIPLIADEQSGLARLVAGLRQGGAEVQVVSSGRDALRTVAIAVPDLILLATALPDLDGFEMLDTLRSRGTRVPTIFISARRTVNEELRAFASGADDYLANPLNLDEVVLSVCAIPRRSKR